ncbi:MAG: hypothetical protein IJH39_04190 [Clostridia bacterium]|nr:hypothetical protein [Clostridia bacterium]
MNEIKDCMFINEKRAVINDCSLEGLSGRNTEGNDDNKYNYYSYDIESNFFNKYIAIKRFGEN